MGDLHSPDAGSSPVRRTTIQSVQAPRWRCPVQRSSSLQTKRFDSASCRRNNPGLAGRLLTRWGCSSQVEQAAFNRQARVRASAPPPLIAFLQLKIAGPLARRSSTRLLLSRRRVRFPRGPPQSHVPFAGRIGLSASREAQTETEQRGCSSDGRAPRWHRGGQGFEPPQLHQV